MQGGHKNKHQTLKSPKGMRSLTHQTWHGDIQRPVPLLHCKNFHIRRTVLPLGGD